MCLEGILGVALAHFGRHTAWVAINHPQDLFLWAKYTFAAELLATPICITFAKLSILFFFRRLFPVRGMRIATAIVGSFVAAYGLSTLLVVIFQCTPVHKAWQLDAPGRCIDVMLWSQYLSVPNIALDVALLILPLPQVWRLHTGLAQKMGLTAAFTLGGFNMVAGAVRMSMFFTRYLGTDPYTAAVPLHAWSILEAASAVVAACLPSLYPFFRRAAQRGLRARRPTAPTPRAGAAASPPASWPARLREKAWGKPSTAASSGWHWSRRVRSGAEATQRSGPTETQRSGATATTTQTMRSSTEATVVGDGAPSVRASKLEAEPRVEEARGEMKEVPEVRAVEMASAEPWERDVEGGMPEEVSPVSPDVQRLPLQRF